MEGILNVLKPPGMSSSDVVVDIRRLTGEKRVGHLGTLDPAAAGVLPVCVGRAARLFDYLVDKEKTYRFELCFGASTDTQDAQGRVTARSDAPVDTEQLLEALPRFSGKQQQLAPAYSALKVDGKKMYDLARKGQQTPERLRSIEIKELRLLERTGERRFLLETRCSRGTYVRTLCADIGEAVGVPAHMRFLLRTQAGSFSIEDALGISELTQRKGEGRLEEALTSCEEALSYLPALTLEAERLVPTKNGLDSYLPEAAEGLYRVYCADTFLGVGQVQSKRLRLTLHLD